MGKHPGQLAIKMEPDVLGRFEELTLPHLKGLYGLAIRLTGDGSAAEDLVQETYLKALQAFPTLRDPGRVRSWLFQILSRLATDRQRTEGREVLTGDPRELDRFSLYDLIAEEDPLPIPTTCTRTSWRSSRMRRCGGPCWRSPRSTASPWCWCMQKG